MSEDPMPPDDPMLPDDPGAAERGGERRRALRAERDRQTERQLPDDPPSVPPALVRPYAAPPQDSALLLVDAPATPAAGVPGDSGPEAVDSPDPEGPDSPDPEGPVSPGPEAPPAPVASEPPGWSAFTPVIPPEPLRFDDESPAAWERERTWAPAPPPGASWMDVEESPAPADADVPQDPAADTVWTAPRGLEQVPASPPPVEPEPERSEVTGPPVRFDELGDDEWLRHLRDGQPDAPVAAHPDPLDEPAEPLPDDGAAAPGVEPGPPAGNADVKPLTPPVGWATDLSQVDLFRSALEEAERTPAADLAPQAPDAADLARDDDEPLFEEASSDEPASDEPREPEFRLPEPADEPADEPDDEPADELPHHEPAEELPDDEPSEPVAARPADDPEPTATWFAAGPVDLERSESDRPESLEPEAAEPEAVGPEVEPEVVAPEVEPEVVEPEVVEPLPAPSPDRPSFGRAPAQRLSEALIRGEDQEEPDDDEPVRGTLAPVLRRSTERARYPTSTTPVIRPPVMPPPPPGEAPAAPPPLARAVSWEQALAGDVLPGKKRRPKGVRRSKPRHESGGAGEEYRPVKPPPDRSLTLLVVAMLLVLVGLVAAAAWTFWPRTAGAGVGAPDGGVGAHRAVGGP